MSDDTWAVERAARAAFGRIADATNLDIALRDAFRAAADTIWQAGLCAQAPSVLYRPTLSRDGDKWCALYGANLMDGVAGFGDTPSAAMLDFDRSWGESIRPRIERSDR